MSILLSSIYKLRYTLPCIYAFIFLHTLQRSEHIVQFVFVVQRQGTFSKFDYGVLRNIEVYGTESAPPYDVSNIPKDFHMFLIYGGRDALSDPNDVQRLLAMLPCNLEISYLASYSHLDFILGTTANVDVYNQIITYFN